MSKPFPKRRAPCNRCVQSTNHDVLWEMERPWSEQLDDEGCYRIEGSDTYTVVQCAGCDAVRLIHRHWFSEETDPDGTPLIHTDYFPPTVTRQRPSWRRNLFPFHMVVANEFNPLFDEIYSAHAAGSYRLAVMGIRALTEKIMVEQVGKLGTFAQTVDAFFQKGFVAAVQQDLFRSVLVEAGHAAMHRGFQPQKDDVETLLDIVESLIDTIYFQPMRAGAVEEKLPPDTRPVKRPRR